GNGSSRPSPRPTAAAATANTTTAATATNTTYIVTVCLHPGVRAGPVPGVGALPPRRSCHAVPTVRLQEDTVPDERAPGRAVPVQEVLRLGSREFRPGTFAVMAIVNRTPDSFYDGGATYGLKAALARVDQAVAEGADI